VENQTLLFSSSNEKVVPETF